MRIDKFLKVSRIIKRRSVAKEIADKVELRLMVALPNPLQTLVPMIKLLLNSAIRR
ncbi:hypothetical protein JCM14108_1345 [Lentilactobacillus farraginis DSM 18382 = JCM 14108]|uniref:RNA-binding protein n=1 Tax=Lentilactobacillus farraginis DSM 18382 = JCM 14108 TaxID=1423743 RepID=X0PAA7_9LACO|nr:hypothetical protein JCM14108_1345 [Lentilactobacillus farraginis DSM 18382 = JCM 14108]